VWVDYYGNEHEIESMPLDYVRSVIDGVSVALDQAAADQLVEVFVDRYRIEREGLARPFPGMLELVAVVGHVGAHVGCQPLLPGRRIDVGNGQKPCKTADNQTTDP